MAYLILIDLCREHSALIGSSYLVITICIGIIPAVARQFTWRLTQAPLQRRHVADFTSAAPGKSEPGAAVAVVVNDDAAIAKFFALKPNA